MRALSLLLLACAITACGDSRVPSATASIGIGPDALLLRLPSAGGTAYAYRAGGDSVLFESRTRVPGTERLLGFDEFQGLVLGRDSAGRVFGLDLRLGSNAYLGTESLKGELVTLGASVFGFDGGGRVLRLTSVGTWSWTAPGGADFLIPQPNGALLVVSSVKGRTLVRRMIPPEPRVIDSISLPAARHIHPTVLGDRVWFDTDSGLIALQPREMVRAFSVKIRDTIVALAATPSGDRVYVATTKPELRIVDRFAQRVRGQVELPQPVTALRMDPDGRYVLARPAKGDSVYVIAIGTARLVTALAGEWRDDLPLVTPDGAILMARGAEAVLVDAESGRDRMRYRNGARDRWMLVRWDGFRPRAAGLDIPVEFEEYVADSASADSALTALLARRYGDLSGVARAGGGEPVAVEPGAPLEQGRFGEPARPATINERSTWTVSFATHLVEERAREMADRVRVAGRRARVVSGMRDGIPIYRVVLGPFDDREQAERAGMESRLPYWVFEGVP